MPMAVAIEREFGLFIDGELAEPASGEIRDLTEPATGEPLASVATAGEADVDRAVEAARAALAGPWGKTPPNERSRLLHALADALVANRKELAELEARNVGKAISSVKAELNQAVENFRFYGSAIASIAGRANTLGGSPLLLLEGTGRSSGPDRAVELPADDDDVEARAGAGRRLLGRAETGLRDSAHRTAPRRARGRGGLPARRGEHRPRAGEDDRRVPRPSPWRGQGRVHGLDGDRRRDHASRLGADQADHAGARRQEPQSRLRGRESRGCD